MGPPIIADPSRVPSSAARAPTIRVEMVSPRGLLSAIAAIAYWAWASFALVAAFAARSGSEEPPFTEENRILSLAFLSWSIATFVFVWMLASRRGRIALVVLWVIQGVLLITVLFITHGFGGITLAEDLVVAGVLGQVMGLLAITLNSRRSAQAKSRRFDGFVSSNLPQ
jgi:succinate-acetate transporter protein